MHKTRAELANSLPYILDSPKDGGPLKLIVLRPGNGERRTPQSADISIAGGIDGDHWVNESWLTLPDGSSDPEVQVCLMNARCIEAIAGPIESWALVGDNLFVDMDLTPSNMPPGQHFSIGTAEFEVSAEPNSACSWFVECHGRDAAVFVNTGEGKRLRLRGIFARVIKDGQISVGDRVTKIA